MRHLHIACLLLVAAGAVAADLHVWVDEHGATHVTDDPEKVPERFRATGAREAEELRALWDDGVAGPPLRTPPGASGRQEDRTRRALRGALDDLGRGETARAAAALRQVLRDEPTRPEAHWYLALLDRERGRIDSAEAHLRAFLEHAGPGFERWRASAERRLARLADEQRLLDPPAGELRLVTLRSPHFRVQVDAALRRQGAPDFAETVLRYLDDARREVGTLLGAEPAEPLGVVLYGKAAYWRAHHHRFSFQTVGFFDGRIHVVSAAHPAGELRTLLFHEYTHALFREQTGGDRPFWLNEGFAELAERSSKGLPSLTRSERARLRRAIDGGGWISLHRLAPSFGGLDNDEARLAYLISTAAASLVETRLSSAQRGRLLRRLGEGADADAALREALGLDTADVDAALRSEIRARFAAAP